MSSDPNQLEAEGTAAYRRGQGDSAVELFAAAEAAYRAAGDAIKAAEMASNRAVALIGLGRGTEAVAAVEGTPAVFAAAGDRPRQALAIGNLASALEASGQLEKSESAYREAIDLLTHTGDRAALAVTWQALSRLQLRRGDPLAAAASAQAALDAHPRPGWVRRILRKVLGGALRLPGF